MAAESTMSVQISDLLARLGLSEVNSGVCGKTWLPAPSGGELISRNPATGETIATVRMASVEEYEQVAAETAAVFASWRLLPAPKRGEIVRQIGERCAPARTTWVRWSRSRWARFWRKARAKCRR